MSFDIEGGNVTFDVGFDSVTPINTISELHNRYALI
jgi:hypothetical protein